MNEFGKKLASLRKSRGWTQDELAQRLYVTRQAVSKWENGSGMPSYESLLQIADIFGLSLDEMVGKREVIEIASVGAAGIRKAKRSLTAVWIVVAVALVLASVGCTLAVYFGVSRPERQEAYCVGILFDFTAAPSEELADRPVTEAELEASGDPYFLIARDADELGTIRLSSYAILDGAVDYRGGGRGYTGAKIRCDFSRLVERFFTVYRIYSDGTQLNLRAYDSPIGINEIVKQTFAYEIAPAAGISADLQLTSLSVEIGRVESYVGLEIVSFDSSLREIARNTIADDIFVFRMGKEAEMLMMRASYRDSAGEVYTTSEILTDADLARDPSYLRMITDERGFVDYASGQLTIERA